MGSYTDSDSIIPEISIHGYILRYLLLLYIFNIYNFIDIMNNITFYIM
jgi:hypothetical protein